MDKRVIQLSYVHDFFFGAIKSRLDFAFFPNVLLLLIDFMLSGAQLVHLSKVSLCSCHCHVMSFFLFYIKHTFRLALFFDMIQGNFTPETAPTKHFLMKKICLNFASSLLEWWLLLWTIFRHAFKTCFKSLCTKAKTLNENFQSKLRIKINLFFCRMIIL